MLTPGPIAPNRFVRRRRSRQYRRACLCLR